MAQPCIYTYLFFNGNCEEALEFYCEKLGATIGFLARYKESPEAPPPGAVPGDWGDKIMHANLTLYDTILMASDDCSGGGKSSGFALTLTVPTEAEADKVFSALADGGTVQAPLAKTFFSPRYGMLTDRFGIMWMVMVSSEQEQ